jgi:hypothetical protein
VKMLEVTPLIIKFSSHKEPELNFIMTLPKLGIT